MYSNLYGTASFGPATQRKTKNHLYGLCAATLGIALLWYAVWTILCATLVLSHVHYAYLLWAPIVPTIVTLAAAYFYGHRIVRWYDRDDTAPLVLALPRLTAWDWSCVVGAFVVMAVAADIGMRVPTVFAVCTAVCLCSTVLWSVHRRAGTVSVLAAPAERPALNLLRLAVLATVLLALYYFADRCDADDANYINLAIGAKRTVGAIYQFDTMIGDGPNLLHLPTYKFHSYELLGAVLSSYWNVSAITAIEVFLPAVPLMLTALFLFTALEPVIGRYWFVVALFYVATLFFNDVTYASWGIHGIIRYQQGKGFLVTALLPLIAALTARWFVRKQPVDLVALALANVCAVGFSANGLYGGPAASGFVAIAFLASRPRSAAAWKQTIALAPTIVWPAIVAAIIMVRHLALPSEQLKVGVPINMLNYVTGWGVEGRLLIALIAVTPLAVLRSRFAHPALLYVPCVLLLVLNPLGTAAVSAVTGNLGFRIFWSVPALLLVALLIVRLLLLAGVRSERTLIGIATLALAGSIASIAIANASATRIAWHAPSIKVDLADWATTRKLAAMTAAHCQILAPERFSALITQMEDAPYPVFARQLYLVHYRFTLLPANLAMRERLRRIVEGDVPMPIPSARAIAAQGIHVGMIAVAANSAARVSAQSLATVLALPGPRRTGDVMIWNGSCHRSPQ